MIIVKVELHSAINGTIKELGRMHISNRGDIQDPMRGNYDVTVCRKGDTTGAKPTRTGEVLNYPRLSYNMWRLITRALLSAFPEESKKEKPFLEPQTVGEERATEWFPPAQVVLGQCAFDISWIGQCSTMVTTIGSKYCEKHLNMKCVVTGKQATHDCEHTGQFVCGYPLSDEAIHDWTTGGHCLKNSP